MNKKIIYFFILLLFLFLTKLEIAFADITFESSVDKTSLNEDGQLLYTISLKGEGERLPEPPEVNFTDFDVLSISNSSNIAIKEGRTSKEISRIYILSPKSVGKFNLPRLEIKYKGKIYKTDAFDIEVKPGKEKVIPEVFPLSGEEVII